MNASNNNRKAISKKKKHGFTLVELIVVITILVILGTIAFVSLSGYSSSARDSSRISDIANIIQALEITNTRTGHYPTPTNGSGVTYSGGIVWTQGTVGDSVINILGTSNTKFSGKPSDPKYGNAEYTYSLLNTGKEYQIGTVAEDKATTYGPIITPVYAAAEDVTAYVKGNYNGLVAKTSTGNTTYYLALPGIILQSLSGSTELSNPATQSGNLVLNKKGNIPSSYTSNGVQSLSTNNFTYSLLSTSTGIVAYSTTASSLDSTGVTDMMTALYNTYSGSNLKGDTTSANQVNSLITGGTGNLLNLYNGVVSKSVGGGGVDNTPLPTTTFSLSSNSVTIGAPVTISHNCTVPPTGYTSSNTSVATISATTVTTLSAGTTNIVPVGGNCSDNTGKTLTVTTVPDWQAIDLNCLKPNVTVGSQTWAGCNSTIGSIAINYNNAGATCYNYAGIVVACTAAPGGKTTSTMTEADFKSGQSTNIYGALYRYDTMSGSLCMGTGIPASNTTCPCKGGYHLPSQAEWDALETNLGCTGTGKLTGDSANWECMTSPLTDTTNGIGWTSTKATSLKTKLGLTLGGACTNGGSCYSRGNGAFYWSSSLYAPVAGNSWYRTLSFAYASVYRFYSPYNSDFSVRCVRDY